MKAYDSLSTFPDVSPALTALDKAKDIVAVVFSNGTNSMVTNSVKSSPDLGPHASVRYLLVLNKIPIRTIDGVLMRVSRTSTRLTTHILP